MDLKLFEHNQKAYEAAVFLMEETGKAAITNTKQMILNTKRLDLLAKANRTLANYGAHPIHCPENLWAEVSLDTEEEFLKLYEQIDDFTLVRCENSEIYKKVKVLSGGEKVRCLLSKMMISGANCLILDEPTNHLDMESITALNNGLIKFPGVELFSCHDHQFVQTTANRIMEILPGGLIDKITTYDEYLESDELARKRQVYTNVDAEADN